MKIGNVKICVTFLACDTNLTYAIIALRERVNFNLNIPVYFYSSKIDKLYIYTT